MGLQWQESGRRPTFTVVTNVPFVTNCGSIKSAIEITLHLTAISLDAPVAVGRLLKHLPGCGLLSGSNRGHSIIDGNKCRRTLNGETKKLRADNAA